MSFKSAGSAIHACDGSVISASYMLAESYSTNWEGDPTGGETKHFTVRFHPREIGSHDILYSMAASNPLDPGSWIRDPKTTSEGECCDQRGCRFLKRTIQVIGQPVHMDWVSVDCPTCRDATIAVWEGDDPSDGTDRVAYLDAEFRVTAHRAYESQCCARAYAVASTSVRPSEQTSKRVLGEVCHTFSEGEERKKRFTLIYAGGLTKIRGILELINAMNYIKEGAELWLLGPWESEKFRKECEALNGWKYTKYLGFLKQEIVYSYFKIADIGIVNFLPVPNHLNSMPNKPFEYMACSLPIIMSNFKYWRQTFKKSSLYVDPSDPQAIAKTVKKLFEDKALMESMGALNQKLSRNEYNWEKESLKLVNLYKKMGS